MNSLMYEILSAAGLAILFEVGLALWVGKRLAQVAPRAGETKPERALASLSKKAVGVNGAGSKADDATSPVPAGKPSTR